MIKPAAFQFPDLHPDGGGPLRLTRRSMLASCSAAAVVALSASASFAQASAALGATDDAAFLALSRALTGHTDLSPVTAQRIAAALAGDGPESLVALQKLGGLSGQAASPEALMRAAQAAGLGEMAAAIVASWYKGTVDTKAGPVVVAYKEALMYRPVSDGTVVPTYCDFGPMWWQDQLPPGITQTPHNSPEVR